MTQQSEKSVAGSDTMLKRPRAVPFILCSIFLERFSTGGILAILALFLHRKMDFDPNMSTALYHTYEFLIYFFTIFGAIIAESCLGMFRTLASMSFIYSIGSSLISFGGIETIDLPFKTLSVIGLLLTVVGSGCLKSNLNAFGGNQFKLPEQAEQLSYFFSLQYFALKCGSTIARASFPILREDVKCFGMSDCYPLAFALPAIAMFLACVVLICGKRSYVHEASHDNMFIQVTGCVLTGFTQKIRNHNCITKDHWLDYAEEKYGKKLVKDTKTVLRVLMMYTPLPIFWALHSQQGSRWVFQATKMDGDIGFYIIKPDQMIVLNSFLGIVLIPIFEHFLYPFLSRLGLKTSLQKMTLGGLLSAVAFVVAAIVEFQTERAAINILWMFPQYLILVAGEILVYTANLNFTFTEAPSDMKSVMLGFSYLSVAGGCLIVILISGVAFFESQAFEFLFFAGVAFLDIIAFGFLASRYKYAEQEKPKIVIEK